MKKYGWYCIAFSLIAIASLAQELPYALTRAQLPIRSISGNFPAYNINDTYVDASGDTYITGYFRGQADFDPSVADSILISQVATIYDAFLAKYDASGNLVYAKAIRGSTDKRSNTIALLTTGKILIAGYFFGTANFDPGVSDFSLVSNGGSDAFYARFDATTGDFEFASQIGGTGNDGVMKVVTSATNDGYAYGYFAGTVDFDVFGGVDARTAVGTQDRFLVKYDANLVLQWVNAMPDLFITSIGLDANGFYAAGNFSVSVDADPGVGSLFINPVGSSDIWLSKFDLSGNLVWNNVMAGADFENATDLALDANSNIYLSGPFNQATDFDPAPATSTFAISNGLGDAYVAKYDNNGAFQWVRSFGGIRGESAPSLTRMQNNTIGVAINFFSASIDADPEGGTRLLTNAGPDNFGDAAIILLTENGSLVDAFNYGTASVNESAGIINSDGIGRFSVVGNFTNPVDFDPSPKVVSIQNYTGFQQAYLTSYSLLASLPASQPTTLSLTNQTGSSIDVSFTGSGADNYLVLRRANAAPISKPADGDVLNSGDFLEDATIAYSGPSTSFIDQGLAANTLYHYAVYAYNTTGGSANYLTTAPLIGNSGTTAITYTRTTDSLALVALYNAANGPGWTNSTNWLSGFIDTWNGVTVNGNRVTRLALGSNLLSGYLSSAIGNLTALDTLELWGNQITGTIPSEIGSLTSLRYMDLSPNQFTGSVPAELGNLTLLTTLWINNNKLTGSIPSELGNLVQLQNLYLQGNQLTGPIPTTLGNLNSLVLLDASANLLSGGIPVELGSLSSLVTLKLNGNQLTGGIPVQLSLLSALQVLNLDQNLLTGAIPLELGDLTLLLNLKLNSNQLSGSIPSELGNLSALQFIDLGGNQLTGLVPASLCSISTLQTLGLARNQLSGTFPATLTSATSLVNLWIDTNQFTGAFPSITSVTNPAIDVATINNNLFDALPDLSSLTGILSYIDVRNNNLTFEDLEANAGVSGISYSPQNPIPGSGNITLSPGQPFSLSYTIGGASNLYQWQKNNVDLPLENSDSYSNPTVASVDGGLYTLLVTNPLVPGLTISPGAVKLTVVTNYYWIGDGGDWKDISHWSLTSGANDPPAVLPGKDDNVFFDANSFTQAGQIVYILDDGSSTGVSFRSMDWRGVANNPTFQILATTSEWISNECYGSLYFDDNMIIDFNAAEFYMYSDTDYDFDTRGHSLGENSWLWFNGQYPVTTNILSDVNYVRMYASKGTVNFNGHAFTGQLTDYPSIWLAGTSIDPVIVDFSNSIVDVGTLQMNPLYNTLIDDNAEITIRTKLNAGDQNFNHLKFGDNPTILPIAATNVYDTLEILPGAHVKFLVGTTQVTSAFIADGLPTGQSTSISSSTEGVPAIISKASGTVNVSHIRIQDIAATGGATFNAQYSYNDGGNTGWNFIDNNQASETDMVLLTTHHVKSQNSSSQFQVFDLALDVNDNVIITGFYDGTVDFDGGVGQLLKTATVEEEDCIVKYNADGSIAWFYDFPRPDIDTGYSIDVVSSDASGNIITGGNVRGTYDVDPGTGVTELTSSNDDLVFTKLTAAGDLTWAKQLTFSTSNFGDADIESITVDDLGNILIAGDLNDGTLDADPSGPTANITSTDTYEDVFLAKYDANGNHAWAIKVGSDNVDEYTDAVITDSQNNIYLSYNINDIIDKHVIRKYSPAGSLIWTIQNENTSIEAEFNGIKIDEANNRIYLTGDYDGTPTFTGTTGSGTLPFTSEENSSGYVAVYDLNGAFLNAFGFQSLGEAYPVSIDVLLDGNLLITGGYEGIIDMDPSAGTFEHFYTVASFIIKLTPAGDFIWGASLPGSEGLISKLNSQNELVGMLIFQGPNDVDVDPTSGVTNLTALGNDFALLKYNIQGTTGVSSADSLALQQFYTATGGPNWTTKTNWLSGDVDNWFGVTVTNNKITAINLPGNNLTGTVPAGSLILNELTTLNLSGNNITEVPDFSALPNLASANVSNNRLDFASLEYNVDVTGIDYSNQKPISIGADSVLVATGDDYTLSTAIGGTANEYQWKRNGNLIANSTASEILIENMSRQNMGSYSIEVTNTLVPNLTLTSVPVNILATATLSGKLLMPTAPASAGVVRLLRVTSSNGYDTIKTQAINVDGTYSFNQVVLDDYQIVGFADTLIANQQRALPTYYPGTLYWEEADTLFVENSLADLDIVSQVEPTEPLVADGAIVGIVQEDDGTGSRTEKNTRVGGAGVSARRAQGTGRGKEILELVAYVFTDENGAFTISGLPPNDYRINIQYPGYPMDETSFIDIPVGSTPLDETVNVEATVADGKISVRQLVITAIEGDNYKAEAYPNPARGVVTISFENTANQRSVSLMDARGKELETKRATELSVKMEMGLLEPGLYVVKVIDAGNEVKIIRITIL